MNSEIQEKINQIQLLQQNLQNFSMQRQQFQLQDAELESALSELAKTDKAYKIIGNVMVSVSKEELTKELEERKHMMQIRIQSIEKQESSLKQKAESLQKEIMDKLEKKRGKNDTD